MGHTRARDRLKIAAKIDGKRIMLKASGQWRHAYRNTGREREAETAKTLAWGDKNEQYHFCVSVWTCTFETVKIIHLNERLLVQIVEIGNRIRLKRSKEEKPFRGKKKKNDARLETKVTNRQNTKVQQIAVEYKKPCSVPTGK